MGQDQSQTKASQSPSGQRQGRRGTSKRKAKLEDIIVVSDHADSGKNQPEIDNTMRQLENLAMTPPIIRNVGNITQNDIDLLPHLNPNPLTEMLLRYQYHMTECAEAVSFDQNAITKRMREIELFSVTVMKEANERQKHMDTILGKLQKVVEIDSLVDRIHVNLDKTLELMKKVNQALPDQDKLPEECFKL